MQFLNWSEKMEPTFQALADICMDFTNTALIFGRIIITELFLDNSEKTITPIDAGGIAGGIKYSKRGILFKFPSDTKLPDGSWLYGGTKPDLEKAICTSGHELKSLNALFTTTFELGIANILRFPLMTMINFRGFRLVALSFLPVASNTLVLGSQDGGMSMMDGNNTGKKLLSRTCNKLGLAEHLVGGVVCPGPGDLELHVGLDNNFYLLDFARYASAVRFSYLADYFLPMQHT
jgi:hypothetical protein